jgi:hypothetical protein
MKIRNSRVYDTLKWIAQIGLPVVGTLYFVVAGIWDLPAVEQVIGVIVCIDAGLGVVLGISSSNYSSEQVGDIVVTDTGYSLNLNGLPEEIEEHDEIRFQVNIDKQAPTIDPLNREKRAAV